MAAHDDVQYLVGSPVRSRILEALREEPLRPTELTDRVDATRTTVQRILSGFQERNWVVKRGPRYTVTVTGRGVLESYETLLEDVERAAKLGPFAAHAGPVADRLPWDALEGARVTVPDDRSPFAPVRRLVELVSAADEDDMRAVSPIVAEVFNQAAVEFLETGGSLELIIDEGVLEASRAGFPEALDRARTNGYVDVLVHPEPLEFGLVAFENRAVLGAYDDENNVRAVVESDAPGMVEWATAEYERYRSRAEPLERLLEGG
ncbi:MAG: helix-turn-helix domain-containing protein [Haloferacaceae archaeon]